MQGVTTVATVRARRFLSLLVCSFLMGAGTSYAQSCGYCPLDTYWGGVEIGAYRFDYNVPSHVQQATFWADDGWGQNFHDQYLAGLRIEHHVA